MEKVSQNQGGQSSDWGNTHPPLTLPGGRAVNPWLVLLSIIFGFFMSLLDATIVNIALSDIQTKLNTDLTTVSWVLSAYNLVFAALLVTMGRMADQFGRKRMFMIGMVLFSFGSLLCALAPSIGWLIGFRALQAIGAATLNPISLAILTVVFPPDKRGAAIGIWGAMAGLAAAAGPVLGGFLVQNFDWRWIFFVNLPFCIIGLFMVYRFVPESRDQHATRRLDLPGFITLTAGLFLLVLAIIEGNDWGWTSATTFIVFGVAVVSLVLFIVVETRQKQPILDFSLFKIRTFMASNLGMFMFGVAIQGAFLIFVLYFIEAQGYSQLDAAYALLPMPLAGFVTSAVVSQFSRKINPWAQAILGMALVSVGLFTLATLDAGSGYWDTAWRAIIIGVGQGLCFTSFPAIVLSQVPRNKSGVASGAFNTFRQIGFALGVAILISIFSGTIKDNITTATGNAISIVKADTNLPQQMRDQIVVGLQNAASQGQSGGQAAASNSGQFDLTKQIPLDRIPNGQALKPELQALNGRIATQFKTGVIDTFRVTWIVAGIVAILGLLPTLFTRAPRRPATAEAKDEQESRPVVPEIG